MAAPGNSAGRYQVHCSGAIAKSIRRIHQRAWQQGRGKAVTRAFRQIVRRLEVDPLGTGEAAYRLPSLRMQVRSVAVRPLVIDFAVCQDRPLVFIKGVKLLATQES
jgi:hypothetical protein